MNVLGIVPRINPQNVLGIVPRIVSFPGSFSGSFRAGAAELSLAPTYPKWIRPKRGVLTFHCACACSNWPRVEMAGMHSSGSDEPPNDPERRCLSDGDVKKAVEAIQYLSSLGVSSGSLNRGSDSAAATSRPGSAFGGSSTSSGAGSSKSGTGL